MNIELIKNIKKYKPQEVCDMLDICYKTLYRWDKTGVLVARRTDTNRRFYLYTDLEEFIDKNDMQYDLILHFLFT